MVNRGGEEMEEICYTGGRIGFGTLNAVKKNVKNVKKRKFPPQFPIGNASSPLSQGGKERNFR